MQIVVVLQEFEPVATATVGETVDFPSQLSTRVRGGHLKKAAGKERRRGDIQAKSAQLHLCVAKWCVCEPAELGQQRKSRS